MPRKRPHALDLAKSRCECEELVFWKMRWKAVDVDVWGLVLLRIGLSSHLDLCALDRRGPVMEDISVWAELPLGADVWEWDGRLGRCWG